MPSPTWSASARTSVSTRARCTPVACGTDVRAAPVSSLPAAPRSRWSRLSGSGLSRENHAVTGQPVARLARSRVESATALTTVGTPAASAKASSSAATRSLDRVGHLAGAGRRLQALGRRAHVGLEPGPGDLLLRHALGDQRPQLVDAPAVAGADRQHRDAGQAVGLEQAAYVVDHAGATVLGHRVDVVEHDQHHVLVPGEGLEEAVVDGSVGVLLRVEDPHHHVGELDEPLDLEVVGHLGGVVVGEVEQHDAAHLDVLVGLRQHRVAGDLVAGGDAEPLQQLLGALACPTRTAVAHDVVGRRTPTADSSSPLSALNVEDLPEPVAPASATTVCSADSLSRLEARAATAVASSTMASSTRPRAASAARSRPSTRAPMSELLVTSFLAPSSNDVMTSSPSEWCCCAPQP